MIRILYSFGLILVILIDLDFDCTSITLQIVEEKISLIRKEFQPQNPQFLTI